MPETPAPIEARIVDFRMPFWSMVVFLVQVAIAAIPAIIILAIIGGLMFAVVGGIGASMMHRDAPAVAANMNPAGVKQDEAPPTPDQAPPTPRLHAVSDARYAAVARCERAFSPGDAQMRCVTQESDCLRKYGEHVDPGSPEAAAQIACFNAVQP